MVDDPSQNLLLRGAVDVFSEKELIEKIRSKKNLRVKLGVDPTSPDLHLGHTVALNKLKQFQDLGHTVVFIIGDLTAWIGDPSGQNETRPRISESEIDKNAATYLAQVFKIIDPKKTEVRKNSEWLKTIFDPEMLRREGSVFSILFNRYTVQQLMQREDFAQRMKAGTPISMAELLYPLLQGYDSVAVQADVELGGTDQLFNLLMGRELQKDFGQAPQVAMTLPLLVGTDGTKKMSKSYKNFIALNDSPTEMFGKLMSISDTLMWQYYELLTSEDLKAIKKMHPKEAKMKLSFLITELYQGKEAAAEARKEFEKVFSRGALPEEIQSYQVSSGKILLSHLLFESGLSPSKNEAKRLIENGGVRRDGVPVEKDGEIEVRNAFVLQVGKRKFRRITCPL